MKKHLRIRIARWVILIIVGLYLLVPIAAMLDFSFRPYGGGNQNRSLRAIVLVVGISPLYRFISIHITESPLALAGIYSMLVLPYVYRSLSSALDIADINTLYEAARTLGSGTMRLMIQVIMPTIRSGIMNGAVIAIALVLGEFTIASLLNFENLQVTLFQVGRSDGNVAVAVSVASLLLVLILLILIPTTQRKKSVLDVDVA